MSDYWERLTTTPDHSRRKYTAPDRECRYCHTVKPYPAAFRQSTAQCRACYTARAMAWQTERREQQRLAARARDARRRAAEKAARPPKMTIGPFDRSVAVLELTWGPYATWTPAHHATHSVLLRRMVGLPDYDHTTDQTSRRLAPEALPAFSPMRRSA
jgi:hypothetical protein